MTAGDKPTAIVAQRPARAGGALNHAWDGLNRMVAVDDGGDYAVAYKYDALNRRIARAIDDDGDLYLDLFWHDGWREIEEARHDAQTPSWNARP